MATTVARATRMRARTATTKPKRRLFTTDEYHRMGEVGILGPDERLELIDGVIYIMSPIGDRHYITVNLFTRLLVIALGIRAVVSIQNPVKLAPIQEPEPDVVVLRAEAIRSGVPTPADVLLVIEVADSTLRMDRGRKLVRYAHAGIPEYWIVNLRTDQIEVYREPFGDGYRESRVARRGERVSLLAFPDVEFVVDDVLP